MDGRGRSGSRGLAVEIGDSIGVCGSALRVVVVFAEGIRVSVLAVHRLRLVWDDLHAAGDGASGATSAGSVGGGGRATIALGKLFNESVCDVVSCDVNSVGDTGNDEGALGGERKGGTGSVEARSGGVLDFADFGTGFADYATD